MSVDTWIRIWRGGFAVSFFGASQFLVCCILAMILYPGGNFANRHYNGYSPTQNFVSDLGRTVSISGQPNPVASRIFNVSMLVFAICMTPFYLFMPMQAWDKPTSLVIAALIGGAASIALMIAAAHPTDLYPSQHYLALFAWVFLLFLSTSIHGFSLLTSQENVRLVLPLVSIGVAMLAIGYCISATETAYAFVFFKPEVPLQSAVLEKLVFLSTMIWLFAFSLRMLLFTDFSEYRMKQRDIDAEEYLGQIGARRSAD